MEFIEVASSMFQQQDETSRMLQVGETIHVDVDKSDNAFDVWDNLPNMLHFNTTSTGPVRGARDVEVPAVITSLRFNALIFVFVILLYECACRIFPSVYRNNRASDIVFPKFPLPLSWVPTILRVSWSHVRNVVGMDGYFFLRYIRLCFQITVVSGIWGIAILWPVYAAGGNGAHGWYHLSMANLKSGSWALWFPTAFMCFLVSELKMHT
jgi:Late exocytosis, associated with Golgi transport